VSDPSEDGSSLHPFDSIQEGVDAASDGEQVLVRPGTYVEEVVFKGKAITVHGIGGAPILEAPDSEAVSFYYGEARDSVLRNFIIRNSYTAVFIAGSSPTINNVTIVDNVLGIGAYGMTPWASMSEDIAGDNNGDGIVNMIDLAILAENRLR